LYATLWLQLGVLLASSLAQPVWAQLLPPVMQSQQLDAQARQSLLQPHFALLDAAFTIPPKYLVDADLRESVQAMVTAEMPRMRKLVQSWLDEELAKAPQEGRGRVPWRVWARLVNEMALWQLDRDGPAHEHLLQQAFLQPGACEWTDTTTSYLALLLQVWRQVPLAKRSELLTSELTLLRRWGLPRALVAAPPQPSSYDMAVQVSGDLLAGRAVPTRAMPPMLAWRLLGEEKLPESAADRHTRCLMDQWMLAMDMQQGAASISEAAARRHRFGRMPTADVWMNGRSNAAAAPTEYPELARWLEIEGSIMVQFTLNARGLLQSSKVVKREITMPGVGAQRPVAMEMMLDEASLVRAAAMKHAVPEPESLQQGMVVKSVTFNWKLK
jgi:hypothetical protein